MRDALRERCGDGNGFAPCFQHVDYRSRTHLYTYDDVFEPTVNPGWKAIALLLNYFFTKCRTYQRDILLN